MLVTFSDNMRIFISTGEVSGDVVGARLTAELLRRSGVKVFGLAGRRTHAAGADLDFVTNTIGAVGVTEAVATVPVLLRACVRIRSVVRRAPPDVAVLVGNDLFNACLGRWLRRQGVPTVGYFPPQVWIWRSLARPIARSFDAVLASFPEEQAVYARAGARVSFVGHYLADTLSVAAPFERVAARAALGLLERGRVIGLMPGSRPQELRALTPVLLEAASKLLGRDASLHFVLPLAEPSDLGHLSALLRDRSLSERVQVVADSHTAMRASDLVLVASGTATLEAALLGIPMVIVYTVSPMTHLAVRACIRLGLIESYTVGLPNLIGRREIVPELLQSRATSEAVACEAWAILSSAERQAAIRHGLAEVAAKLRGGNVMAHVADLVLAIAGTPRGRHRTAPLRVDPSVPEAK